MQLLGSSLVFMLMLGLFVKHSSGFLSKLPKSDAQEQQKTYNEDSYLQYNNFQDKNENLNTGQLKEKKTSNSSKQIIRLNIGDDIKLKCQVPVTHGNMIWERSDLIYPLAVSGNRFSPDERIQIRQLAHNLGELLIANATVEDSGEYHCRTSFRRQQNPECNASTQSDNVNRVFKVIVEKKLEINIQVDVPNRQPHLPPTKVKIFGPELAFYGMPVEFICRANFSSPDAKRDPSIHLEWYHNGVRRKTSRSQSGGTYVTTRWVDSQVLESRLLLNWASEKDSGKWFCVDRTLFRKQQKQTQRILLAEGQNDADASKKLINDNPNNWGTALLIPYDILTVQVIDLPEPEYEYESPSPLIAVAAHLTATKGHEINQTDDVLHNSARFWQYPHLAASNTLRRYAKKPTSTANKVMPPLLFLLISMFPF